MKLYILSQGLSFTAHVPETFKIIMGSTSLSARNLIVLFLLLGLLSQGNCRKNNAEPSAVIVGTVYCDSCFEQQNNKLGHFISGASIQVQCADGTKNTVLHKTTITNQKGSFKFNIPQEVNRRIQSIKSCTVNLTKTNHATFCDPVADFSTTSASGLNLKSRRKNGIHVYSAGFFTFKPQKQPAICDQKVDQPGFFFFPPNPFQPPNIGGIPVPQNPLQPPPPSLLPPGFQPTPPSIFPPGLPFQPPPPPPLLPPVPTLPVPPLTPNIPIITPPPPPPPPPPVFPFPPFFPPGFPGIPPGFP